MKKKRVGVLALQGDFEAHQRALRRVGADAVQVRGAEEMDSVDGLVIPGGESTTMLKLLDYMKLKEPLLDFARRKPVFGTCAGAILLASEVRNPAQESLGVVDMTVERNAYGRQIDSRVARIAPDAEFRKRVGEGDMEAVFIRAPIIRRTGPDVNVLAEYDGDPVLVEQGKHLIATFHPELTEDARVHRLFLEKTLIQVHFVCIGNTCRSPMAEGLANHYGSDVLIATSSGLSPVAAIVPETVEIMHEINIDVSGHVPAWYQPLAASQYDLVVNISGMRLPGKAPQQLLEWQVDDPFRKPQDVYRRVRGELENRVMQLILQLRKPRKS